MMKSLLYVWANYTLYCVCVIMGRRTRAAAAEANAVGVQTIVLVLHMACQSRGTHQTHAAHPTSAPGRCWTAHMDE